MPIWHPSMTAPEREAFSEYRRRRYLPEQIAATRRKLAMLENEARRYGMDELLAGHPAPEKQA